MKFKKNIMITLGVVSSAYTFAGNDWYVHVSNYTANPVPVTVSGDYGCFYVDDFTPKTIPANGSDSVYLEERDTAFSTCDSPPVNKFATLFLNNNLNNSINLNSYYSSNNRYRNVTTQGYLKQIAGSTVQEGGQRIDVYISYENDGTITMSGYCNTDGPCTE